MTPALWILAGLAALVMLVVIGFSIWCRALDYAASHEESPS